MTRPMTLLPMLLLGLAGCGSSEGKASYADDPDLDSGGAKSDAYTSRMDVLGVMRYGDSASHEYAAGRYAAFTFQGARDDVIDVRVESDDADPVLLVYGPQQTNGKWGKKLVLRDDDEGLNPHLTSFRLSGTGTFLLLTGDYDRGEGSFEISLACTTCQQDPHLACDEDSDCVEIPTSCCPCSSGGRSTAVNEDYAEELSPECDPDAPIACLAVYLCTGDVPTCKEGQCTLAPPRTQGQFCGGIAGLPCPDGQECHLEGDYPDAGGYCRPDECTRSPQVPNGSPRYGRFEAPGFANDCLSDSDCQIGGCSGEVCAAEGVITTCEAMTGSPTGSCGCVGGTCQWWECQ